MLALRSVRALAALTLTGVLATGCTPAAPESTPSVPAPVPTPSTPTPSLTPTPTPTPTPTRTPTPTPTPRPTPTKAPEPDPPTIVIDPGHSGTSIRSTDRSTGLRDIDYPNYPEIYEMFDVSACAGQALRRDGYRVVLTKQRALDSVSLAARARKANGVDADLAVSVHDDHSQTAAFEATYSQRGVTHDGEYHAMYRGTGRHRTVFDLPAVAKRSERAAELIARARSRAQGRPVAVRENIYTGRPPLEPGNLALVQLLTRVPWVYNEMGALTGGDPTRRMSLASERGYAEGLVAGIEAAVPLPAGPVTQPSRGAAGIERCLTRRR